ncbi:MAG: head GIN domain-containing protein [Bacteroidales bacterium]
MKTTNRILLTAFIVLILLMIAVIVSVRFSLAEELVRGSGEVIEEERMIDPFNSIEAKGNLQILLQQNDQERVMVAADDNLLDLIETYVNGNTLYINLLKPVGHYEKMEVTVAFSDLDALEISRNGRAEAPDGIRSDYFTHKLHSGAKSTLHINVDELTLDLSSGAHAKLSGSASLMNAESSSGASLDATDLEISVCSIKASSGATNSLFVTSDLSAKASSGGVIRYSGDPTITSMQSSSGGRIIK